MSADLLGIPAIEWRTRSRWSHAEAITKDYTTTFGAMLKNGVQYRLIGDPLYRDVSETETWRIPCTDSQKDAFWNFMNAQNNKPYDWRAILAFQIGDRDWTEPDSWFCSELQMAGLKSARPVELSWRHAR